MCAWSCRRETIKPSHDCTEPRAQSHQGGPSERKTESTGPKMNSGSFAAHLRNKWWYRRCVCHARWWDAEPPAGRGGGNAGWWRTARGIGRRARAFGNERGGSRQREDAFPWRKGSDVLPVSIIIGGWLTGRRFAPHNSRRPIILPRLPCTNSCITCRHVPPYTVILSPRTDALPRLFGGDYRGLRKTAHTHAVCISLTWQ